MPKTPQPSFVLSKAVCLLGILLLPASTLYAQNTDDSAEEARPDAPGEVRQLGKTAHFGIYRQGVEVPVAASELEEEVETIYDYVTGRLNASADVDIPISFQPSDGVPCGPRGIAWRRRVVIYVDESMSRNMLLGVLAHELGHVAHFNGVSNALPSRGLVEGLATWAAGRYWLASQEQSSFKKAVRSYINQSSFLPLQVIDRYLSFEALTKRYPDSCLERRDILYTEWAAFIDFLIATYGHEKLYSLLEDDTYENVYGATFSELVVQWMEYVEDD